MSTRQDYINKMDAKKQAKLDSGLLSEKFPKVSSIVIFMVYYHNAENPVLMERTVNIFPTSPAFFKMECMIKNCEKGGFDLTSIIRKQIKQRKKTVKGEMNCKGKGPDLASNHASISYEITIKYKRGAK